MDCEEDQSQIPETIPIYPLVHGDNLWRVRNYEPVEKYPIVSSSEDGTVHKLSEELFKQAQEKPQKSQSSQAAKSTESEEPSLKEEDQKFPDEPGTVVCKSQEQLENQESRSQAKSQAIPESDRVEWEEVKQVCMQLKGFDQDGVQLKWVRENWGPFDKERTLKKDWKLFMKGIPTALKMLNIGEESWFGFDQPAQESMSVIWYPTDPKRVYIFIRLISVTIKQAPKPGISKPYNIEENFQKIMDLKKQADKDYKFLRDASLSLPCYIKISNKLKGLLGAMRKREPDETISPQLPGLQVALNNNIALMHLMLKDYEKSLKYTEKVLEVEPDNSKAILRKACCLENLDSLEEALNWYLKGKEKEAILRVKARINKRKSNMLEMIGKHGL